MSHEEPPNWVKMRAECNLDICYDSIRSLAKRDVDAANQLPETIRKGFKFVIQEGGGVGISFYVVRKPIKGYAPHEAMVSFAKRQSDIGVSRLDVFAEHKDDFNVVAEWREKESRCVLTVDGRELEPWQITKRALEPLFFG